MGTVQQAAAWAVRFGPAALLTNAADVLSLNQNSQPKPFETSREHSHLCHLFSFILTWRKPPRKQLGI